jgi:polyisoprenyl-teichoic acid--peptidoglycan teichoic acid transferase
MRRRGLFVAAALVAWIAGATLGSAPHGGGPRAQAAPAIEVGKVKANFTPSLTGTKPIFILALGSDARTDEGTPVAKGLGDSIHIIGINPAKNQATILGFPRDSWVNIPGHGNAKINEALFDGGPELMAKTLTSITGIPIDYYVLTSFDGVKNAVDEIGGLVIDVPWPMHDSYSKADFKPGVQRLKGFDVLAFARDRHNFTEGDFARSENQGRVLLAALAQFNKEYTKDPGAMLSWIGAGEQNIQTSLTLPELLNFAYEATSFNPEKVENIVAQGSIGFEGPESVVHLLSSNAPIYKDMKADAIVAKKHLPPSPTAGNPIAGG